MTVKTAIGKTKSFYLSLQSLATLRRDPRSVDILTCVLWSATVTKELPWAGEGKNEF